jgi:hypothetical protein
MSEPKQDDPIVFTDQFGIVRTGTLQWYDKPSGWAEIFYLEPRVVRMICPGATAPGTPGTWSQTPAQPVKVGTPPGGLPSGAPPGLKPPTGPPNPIPPVA